MRKWRVGTFSMGILLILVGILLLLGELSGISSVKLIFTWWPLILITLGLEVLAHVYFSGQESPTVKYDGFSIFIILLIIIITLLVYGVRFAMLNIPEIKEHLGNNQILYLPIKIFLNI
jgi:membrane-bound ClpP family serine protease